MNGRRLRLVLVLVAGFFVIGGIQAPSALADTCNASSAPSAMKTFPCDCQIDAVYQDDGERVWIGRCSEIGTGVRYDHCYSIDMVNWLCEGKPADGSLPGPDPMPLGVKTPQMPPVIVCAPGTTWSDGSSWFGVQTIIGTNRRSGGKTLTANWSDGTATDYTVPTGQGWWFATPVHSYSMSGGSQVWVDLNGGHSQPVGQYGMEPQSRTIFVTDSSQPGVWSSCSTSTVDPPKP